MLIEEMKQQKIRSKKSKSKDTLNILNLVIGELETISKRTGNDITDEMVVQSCKKIIQSNNETLKHVTNEATKKTLLVEITVLESYLPTQLDEAQLREIITSMGAKHIGEVMKTLKTDYAGRYDGKLASALARELV